MLPPPADIRSAVAIEVRRAEAINSVEMVGQIVRAEASTESRNPVAHPVGQRLSRRAGAEERGSVEQVEVPQLAEAILAGSTAWWVASDA